MKFLPVLGVALALSSVALAQTPSQQNAARATFARFRSLNQAKQLNTAPARALVVGEAKDYASSATLGALSQPDALVFPDANHAVTRVQGLDDKNKPVVDVYFYLVRSGANWKVSALRSLALTGILGAARDELEGKPKLTAKERDELANLRLTLALDSQLRDHFLRNRAAFARLSAIERSPLLKTEGAKLHNTLAFDPDPYEEDGTLEWIVGGVSDNTVGYGFSQSGTLPPIEANRRIWVERLSAKWYLFRTT